MKTGITITLVVAWVGLGIYALSLSTGDEQCADLTAQVYALQEQLEFSQEERQIYAQRIAKLQAQVEALEAEYVTYYAHVKCGDEVCIAGPAKRMSELVNQYK